MNKIILRYIVFFSFVIPATAKMQTDVKFDKKLDMLETKIGNKTFPLITHKKHTLSKEAANDISNAVFASNPISQNLSHTKMVKENDNEFIFKAGTIEYRLSKIANNEMLLDLKRYTKAEKTDAIDSLAAKQIALAYIKKHMKDVDENEMFYSQVVAIMLSTTSGYGRVQGDRTDSIANYIVMFNRQTDNIPIIGPGGKIRVYLSRNGDVVGYSKLWRKYEKEKTEYKNVVSPKKFKEKFINRITAENYSEKDITLKSIEFGYFEAGRNKNQKISIPMYEMEYTYRESNSKRLIRYFDAYTGDPIEDSDAGLLKGDSR